MYHTIHTMSVLSGDKAAVFSDEKRSQSLVAAFTQQQSKSGTLKPRINGEKQHICVRMGLQLINNGRGAILLTIL